MKYTKGPWHVQIGDRKGPMANGYIANIGIFSQVRLDAAMAYDENEDADDDKWVSGIWGKLTDVDIGNAHLIAAAPDMLEALEAMRTVMDMGDKPTKLDAALTWRQCDDKARDLCDAAIAKAKGETK